MSLFSECLAWVKSLALGYNLTGRSTEFQSRVGSSQQKDALREVETHPEREEGLHKAVTEVAVESTEQKKKMGEVD